MRPFHTAMLRQTEKADHTFCFKSFSNARSFSKELLADGYEIRKIKIEVQLSQQPGGMQPNMKVTGDSFVSVTFYYNPYEKHDKKLLLRLLGKYKKSLVYS